MIQILKNKHTVIQSHIRFDILLCRPADRHNSG